MPILRWKYDVIVPKDILPPVPMNKLKFICGICGEETKVYAAVYCGRTSCCNRKVFDAGGGAFDYVGTDEDAAREAAKEVAKIESGIPPDWLAELRNEMAEETVKPPSEYDKLITLSWQVGTKYLDKSVIPDILVRFGKLLETETDKEKLGYIRRNIIHLEKEAANV